MTATLYGDGSDHGQAQVPAVVEKSDADYAAERAARFREEVAPRRDTRTESDRRETHESIKLRLRPGYKARLLALANADGYSAAQWIESWVEISEKELREISPGPTKRRKA